MNRQPPDGRDRDRDRGHDPSIDNEPHLTGNGYEEDPSESKARAAIDKATQESTETYHAANSVWDEPGLSRPLAGATPADALTYAGWLERKIAETGSGLSWAVTIAAAAAAGPFAIFGALLQGGQTAFAVVMITIVGPVAEEGIKVAVALWIVETRPYLFRWGIQIVICALAGGLAFAAIENVMYLHLPHQEPAPGLIWWRWTVCVAVHTVCSFIAGLGVLRIWSHTISRKTRPQFSLCFPWFVTAMVIHGLYNCVVVLMEHFGFEF
jgi:hypothetical protein